jgi:membrane protein YqaA with SNARE-associated domain
MDKKTQGILEIIVVLLIIAGVLVFYKDIVALRRYGYPGAFLISLLSSATLFLPGGWAVVIALSRVLNPVGLGVVVGIGSAIGQLTGYLVGDGTRDILSNRVRESRQMRELVEKYDVLAIFVLAFIPNPLFDIAGIVAGGLRIKWWHFLLACMAGRVLRFVLLAVVWKYVLGIL